VDKGLLATLNRAQDLMKSTSNYKQLRAAIATAARPCLPYIGMFLTDLTFIDSANSSRIGPRKELVNMDKYYRMAATILTAEGFHRTPYHFTVNPVISQFLFSVQYEEDQERLHNQSLACEAGVARSGTVVEKPVT